MPNIVDMRPNDNGLVDLVNYIVKSCGSQRHKILKKSLTLVEVGSYQGQSMAIFAQTGMFKKIYCIDPWQSNYDPMDIASYTDMQIVEQYFDYRADFVRQFVDVIKFKGTLADFVNSSEFSVAKGSIDLVYIDAIHTYEGCKNDLTLAKTHLQPRIAYAGHDYCTTWPGVIQAVDEVVGYPSKTFVDESWLKFKNDIT